MLINRIWLIIFTFSLMIVLSVLTESPILAGGITIAVTVVGYIIISFVRSKKRLNILEEKCDPQAFIEATQKQMQITGKNQKVNAYLSIDIAAGLIVKGEFQKAKNILISIDKSFLSIKNGSLLAYTLNLISCLYALGEMAYAEELFETQVPLLVPINPRMIQAMELFVAERFFYLKKYKQSKEKFQQMLNVKISKRNRLEVLFRLAQIDEINGGIDSAKQKYKEVADNSDELWVSLQARNRLENM